MEEVTWYESDRPPEVVSRCHVKQSFSVDVLTYSATKKTHNLAFFDYDSGVWRFYIKEPEVYFRWRYLDERFDKYLIKKEKPDK